MARNQSEAKCSTQMQLHRAQKSPRESVSGLQACLDGVRASVVLLFRPGSAIAQVTRNRRNRQYAWTAKTS